VSYIHLMCARHEVVHVDGCWSESFQPGDHSIAGLDGEARAELLALFPDMARATGGTPLFPPARMTIRSREAGLLFL
ncbi:MAG: Hint domain-containing protein, partial [Shimia sp.]